MLPLLRIATIFHSATQHQLHTLNVIVLWTTEFLAFESKGWCTWEVDWPEEDNKNTLLLLSSVQKHPNRPISFGLYQVAYRDIWI